MTKLLEDFSLETDPPRRIELCKQVLVLLQERFEFPEIDSISLRESVWSQCFEIIESSPSDSLAVLDLIRVLSREKGTLDSIFSDYPRYMMKLIELSKLSEEGAVIEPEEVQIVEASLKALGNIGMQSPVGLGLFATDETIRALVKRLDTNVPPEVHSFDVRLLFLATALKPNLRQFVRRDCLGLDVLQRIIGKSVERAELGNPPPKGPLDLYEKPRRVVADAESTLICDVLKVLYNLTLTSDPAEDEKPVIERLCFLIRLLLLSSPKESIDKKRPLVANIMNLLTTVPLFCFQKLIESEAVEVAGAAAGSSEKLEDNPEAMAPIAVLLGLLDILLTEMEHTNMYDPLFATLLGMSRMAKANSTIRHYLRAKVLPRLNRPDIMKKPEEGSKLRNKLVRLLTHPSIGLKEAAATFLFVLCKENVGRMVKYTGFGNAAGMLSLRGLMGGAPSEGEADYSPDSNSDSDTDDYKDLASNINPVTGCYEEPKPNPTAGMTEEQKEYEALRLVNLIDKMNRKGVIQPVRVGPDGRVHPVEHVLELQEGIDPSKARSRENGGDGSSDED